MRGQPYGSLAEAQRHADRINLYWRERGFDAAARVERASRVAPDNNPVFELVSGLVNGLPPGFSRAHADAWATINGGRQSLRPVTVKRAAR